MLEIISPFSSGQDTIKFLYELARATDGNFQQLNKLVLKSGVSGTLSIDLGSGADKKVDIEITNGIVTNIAVGSGSSAGVAWA